VVFGTILTVFLALPAVFSVLNVKEKAPLEEHAKSAIAISLVGLILGFLAMFESLITPTSMSVLPSGLVSLPTTLTGFAPIVTFFESLVVYVIAGLLGAFVFWLEKIKV